MIGLVSLLAFSAFAEELANVNGVSITTDDYQKALATVPPQTKAQLSNPDEKKRFVNILVDRELLSQEAKKAGMDKDPVFLGELEQAKKEILVNMMAQKLNKEKITDEAMHSYFNKNIKDFQMVHAAHILVKTEEEAKKIKKELSSGGNFEELAKKYSTDTSNSQRGGDLSFFNRKQMVKPFADLAFSLKPKEMGGPVKTQFGFHLIKVLEVKNPKYEELTQENIRTLRGEVFNNEMEKIKAIGKIKLNQEALQKLN